MTDDGFTDSRLTLAKKMKAYVLGYFPGDQTSSFKLHAETKGKRVTRMKTKINEGPKHDTTLSHHVNFVTSTQLGAIVTLRPTCAQPTTTLEQPRPGTISTYI